MKKKVLILEDNSIHFNDILEALNNDKSIKDDLNIYPNREEFNDFIGKFADLYDSETLLLLKGKKIKKTDEAGNIEEVLLDDQLVKELTEQRNSLFANIVNRFDDISIFVIDVALKKGKLGVDILGIDFYNYLVDINYNNGDYFTIFYSINNVEDKLYQSNKNKPIFIAKNDFDMQVEKPLKYNIKQILNALDNTNRKTNWKEWMIVNNKIIIHYLIVAFFYFSISLSLIYSGYNILTEVITGIRTNNNHLLESHSQSMTGNKKDNMNLELYNNEIYSKPTIHSNNKNDTAILNFVEHIFINVIPVLVLLGFYSYYKYNLKPRLVEINISPKDAKDAKESIQLTKTLFLSSIMSYLIIKIIEVLFIKKDKIETQYLISYGILLLFLMSYLIISHKIDINNKE